MQLRSYALPDVMKAHRVQAGDPKLPVMNSANTQQNWLKRPFKPPPPPLLAQILLPKDLHQAGTQTSPRPLPARAPVVLYDYQMSEVEIEAEEVEMEAPVGLHTLIQDLQHRIGILEATAKAPHPLPTAYHYDPALVERLATLTVKMTELERAITSQATHPPPPPPVGPSHQPGLPR